MDDHAVWMITLGYAPAAPKCKAKHTSVEQKGWDSRSSSWGACSSRPVCLWCFFKICGHQRAHRQARHALKALLQDLQAPARAQASTARTYGAGRAALSSPQAARISLVNEGGSQPGCVRLPGQHMKSSLGTGSPCNTQQHATSTVPHIIQTPTVPPTTQTPLRSCSMLSPRCPIGHSPHVPQNATSTVLHSTFPIMSRSMQLPQCPTAHNSHIALLHATPTMPHSMQPPAAPDAPQCCAPCKSLAPCRA